MVAPGWEAEEKAAQAKVALDWEAEVKGAQGLGVPVEELQTKWEEHPFEFVWHIHWRTAAMKTCDTHTGRLPE